MPGPIPRGDLIKKPTLETRFYIDYEWWKRSGQDLRLYIQRICEEYNQITEQDLEVGNELDWIDPETGQVSRVDRLTYIFRTRCSQHPDFISERTSLIDAVFRALLARGNRPMTPTELAERTERSADTILRTLSGHTIYKGIRPYVED